MNNLFFDELTRTLAEQGIQTAESEHGRLSILLEGQPAIIVEPSGLLGIRAKCVGHKACAALYQKVAPFSEMIHEYTSLMERAPLVQSDSGNDSYRLLADFNGIILAGKEKGRYGYQFATWQHDASGTGYEQGHYFMNEYAAAKEDFACRTGLLEKGRQFSDEQLTEISRCLQDALDGHYELTDKQEEIIRGTKKQIKAVIPDINERIAQADETQWNQEQTM